MTRKTAADAFRGALATRDNVRTILESFNIEAEYIITVTDSGPGVEIRVSEKSYGAAQGALPFTIGSATVKIVKK